MRLKSFYGLRDLQLPLWLIEQMLDYEDVRQAA